MELKNICYLLLSTDNRPTINGVMNNLFLYRDTNNKIKDKEFMNWSFPQNLVTLYCTISYIFYLSSI